MVFHSLGNRLDRSNAYSTPSIQYAVVAVDCFTKWAEAKPLAAISSKKVQEFVWESIIYGFRILHEIILDNGMQFDSNEFRAFCDDFGIKKSFFSVDHPQINDQVEAVNKIIKFNLKTRVENVKGYGQKNFQRCYRPTERPPEPPRGRPPFH